MESRWNDLEKQELMIRNCVLTALARQAVQFVPVGISARHVHLSQTDLQVLFGSGHALQPKKELSQPGQFAAEEQVTVVGPKGKLERVRVLGPVRSATQVELAMTDAMKLGIKAPVRMSGDLAGSPGCKLIGPAGELELSQGVIVAARHIHMAGDQAEAYGLHDGDRVSVRVQSARPCVWGDVIIRAGKGHDLEMHIDTDEANSALLSNGAYVELVADTAACQAPAAPAVQAAPSVSAIAQAAAASFAAAASAVPASTVLDLVTEQDVNDAIRANQAELLCTQRAIITPAAADRSAATGLQIRRV